MREKTNYFILIFIISLSSCKAQVYNIDNDDVRRNITGAYYKDIDNQLDKYVGTWLYTNGTSSLKIKIEKKIHYFNDFNNFMKIYCLESTSI